MPEGADAAFLGISRSFTGQRWVARATDDRLAVALSRGHDLPEIVGRVLAARGVTPETAEPFLAPTLRALMPDPASLKGVEAAAQRLAHAIMTGEPAAVFGDYDVDGATSAALLRRFFRAAGADLRLYIPDRVAEGYGPNTAALLALRREGVRVVVTVDCGITAFAPLEAAAADGLDLVVIDHHAAEPSLPRAVAVVNPNRLDETTPHRSLAAVGVTFLVVVAINRALRSAGWYRERAEPNLLAWLDLVALGTVCDMVPLTGLNRALVAQGLKVMARRGNPGLAALAGAAGLAERPDAYHLGFVLGPRVNAGGRVGGSDLGARLLSTDDAAEAAAIAAQLEGYNAQRKVLERAVLDEACAQVTAEDGTGGLVFAVGTGWHPGVVGIVAARLKERYGRPACVVAVEESGAAGTAAAAEAIGRASARSVRGVDIGAAVIAARQAGLLMAGGGHAMAAGFTVTAAGIPVLRAFLAERVEAACPGGPLVPTLEIDGALAVGGATPSLVEWLDRLGPFGAGNAEPRFALTEARIVRADVVGAGHVRCMLAGNGGGRVKAIAFRAADTELGRGLLQSGGAPLHVAGHLHLDRWNGSETVQLRIDDAAPVWGG